MFIFSISQLLNTANSLPIVLNKEVVYINEFPYLFLLDLRIYVTLCALFVFILLFIYDSNKEPYLLSKKSLGSFASCCQGILLAKYTFLAFSVLLNYDFLQTVSNTIDFTKKVYIAIFIVDFLLFFGLTYLPDNIYHCFEWKAFAGLFIYYLVFNIFCSFDFDIYRYKVDFRDSSIIFVFLVFICSFYSSVICPEIRIWFNVKEKGVDGF